MEGQADQGNEDARSDGGSDDGDDQEHMPSDKLGSLSKSWSISTAHVPTFTGGKVTHSRIGKSSGGLPFLLLPVDGDLAFVNSERGVKMATVRGEDALDDDDEDEGVDFDAITSYCLSHSDQFIVTCSRNQLMKQYTVDPSTEQTPFKLLKAWGKSGHTLPVTHMEIHVSNVFLATGSVDGTVRMWDVRGSFVTHVFRPVAGGEGGSGRLSVTSLKWKEEVSELILAIGRDDGSIIIHDLRNAGSLLALRDHGSSVTCLAWWGQHTFLSAGRDSILNVWRIRENETSLQGKKSSSFQASYSRIQTIPLYENVEGMVVLPSVADELVVATAGSKGQVRLWKAPSVSGESIELSLEKEQPSAQAFGDQRGGYMGLIQSFVGSTKEVECGQQLITIDAEHNLSFLFPDLSVDRTIVGHNDDILDLKCIPGSTSRIVCATNSPQIKIFDVGNFSCDVLDGHTATVLCVTVSPCGRMIASCGKDRTMRIWNVQTKKCLGVGIGHTEPLGACCLSRKRGRYDVCGKAAQNGGGAFAISASVDRTMKRWNLPGVEELEHCSTPIELPVATSVKAHDKDINIISIAPNDSLVASGSQDKTIKLWRATDFEMVATLKGHRRGVWDCQFSPIDRVLVSSSGDKTIKLWSLSDYSCVRTFQGHNGSALRVRFLNSGLQLLSSGSDGLLKLWTIRTNECEATLDGHMDKVWALDLFEDGRRAVSGGGDSRLNVWGDNTREVEDERLAKEAELIVLDQKLANHLRRKEFDEALEIALQLDKPFQALKVIIAIIDEALSKRQSPISALQKHTFRWSLDQVLKVLRYAREWNTRSRNSHVAMLLVKSVVTTVPVTKLASHPGIPEVLAGITPYAERHFDRLERLHMSSYLLDYTLTSMGSLDPMRASREDSEFDKWEKQSKLVLPPKFVDGRVQVGGKAVVGKRLEDFEKDDASESSNEDDEVVTIGESDSDESMDLDDDSGRPVQENLNQKEDADTDSSSDSSSSSSSDND